ncbi:MAG: hypothetical protein ACXACG_16850 [Candidatus Thorarchaeota archaeon]
MGVTVFRFDLPGSTEQFVEKVNEWMFSTTEGKRYRTKDPEEGTILKIQRGKGALTAPIIFEFKVGSEGLSTEMLARGYIHVFALKKVKQDLRPDAKGSALPRRNGWKDMLKLLNHADVSDYEHKFQP